MSSRREPATLALADGSIFRGFAIGSQSRIGVAGEVVFNTAMTGYQEIFTDPSYSGQLIVMTYPHIGNYGINDEDAESAEIFAAGVVIRELSERPSNWRSQRTLQNFLETAGTPGIAGVDTRRLTRHIRDRGAMAGAIVHGEVAEQEAIEIAAEAPSIVGRDLVSEVTTDLRYEVKPGTERRFRIAALDFGIKRRILDNFTRFGVEVTVFPARTEATEILDGDFDGVFLSNGPGDPAAVGYAIDTVRLLLGKVPVFGICLGHQLIGLALGGNTYKLHFGHHGGNHPVKRVATGRVEITSQNHGFAVDPVTLGGNRIEGPAWGSDAGLGNLTSEEFGLIEVTHVSLNDGTLEGMRCLEIPAMSVQYHPEAGPGPNDATYLFEEFTKLLEQCR